MTNRLKGKVAIVTGGAGGLGLGIGDCYVREGAQVVLTDVKETDAEKKFVAANAQASFAHQDVAKEDEWEKLVSETVKKFGHLDILVNNAGITPVYRPIDEETLADWQKVIDINLTGQFLGTKHAMKAMKAGDGGSIINVSSVAGLVGNADISAYNASKGGVRFMTKSAALDAANHHYNVRVNSVHPGIIETAMTAGSSDELIKSTTPLGHMGVPDDIGEVCVFLGSDESKFATGSEFTIDGGYTAQ